MNRALKSQLRPADAPQGPSCNFGNLLDMSRRLGLVPPSELVVPAAKAVASQPTPVSPVARPASWPTGVSLLAQMVDACHRCDSGDVCGEWLARAPNSIVLPPEFCPNADSLNQAKKRDLK